MTIRRFGGRSRLLGSFVFLSVMAAGATAQDTTMMKARYAKTEYQVPMRDGKRLFTVAYTPCDTTRRYPIMLAGTPYSVGPYGADRYPARSGRRQRSRTRVSSSYQDVRGRSISEGAFVHMTP